MAAERKLVSIPLSMEAQLRLVRDLGVLVDSTVRDKYRHSVVVGGGLALLAASLLDAPLWPPERRHCLDIVAFPVADPQEIALSTCSSSAGKCHAELCGTAVLRLNTAGSQPFLRAEGILTNPDEIRNVLRGVVEQVRAPGLSPLSDRRSFGVMHALKTAGHDYGGSGLPLQDVLDAPSLTVLNNAADTALVTVAAPDPYPVKIAA